jgi:hypothetical protein
VGVRWCQARRSPPPSDVGLRGHPGVRRGLQGIHRYSKSGSSPPTDPGRARGHLVRVTRRPPDRLGGHRRHSGPDALSAHVPWGRSRPVPDCHVGLGLPTVRVPRSDHRPAPVDLAGAWADRHGVRCVLSARLYGPPGATSSGARNGSLRGGHHYLVSPLVRVGPLDTDYRSLGGEAGLRLSRSCRTIGSVSFAGLLRRRRCVNGRR